MSHSKRNTSRAFFTSHERSQLQGWGSQSARISADQSLPFGSCALCLLPAKDPVACSGFLPHSTSAIQDAEDVKAGQKRKRQTRLSCHIFCRECAITNLLAQKKDLKRLEAARKAADEVTAAEMLAREEEAEALALRDFEQTQAGFTAGAHAQSESAKRKRGAGFDQVDAEREQKRLAMERLIAEEDAQKRAKKMPSFWLPGEIGKDTKSEVIPGREARDGEKKRKEQTICPGSEGLEKHDLSLKSLVSVMFTEEERGSKGSDIGKVRVCPACSKPLNNSSRAMLGKPCGHIICGNCCTKFVLTGIDDGESVIDESKEADIACFVCGESLKENTNPESKQDGKEKKKDKKSRGLMEISCEGTGFASAGKSQVKRKGTAFAFG